MAAKSTPRWQLVAAAVVTLVTAYTLHRLGALRPMLVAPLLGSFGLALVVGSFIAAAVRAERTAPTPQSFTQRQAAALRPLVFATRHEWPATRAKYAAEEVPPPFAPIAALAEPRVARRLDTLLELIRGTFILPWYVRISPSRAFPDTVEGIIRHALGRVGDRAEAVDWPNLVVATVLPRVTEHFQHYRGIEHLTSSIPSTSGKEGLGTNLPLPLPKNTHPALRGRHLSPEDNIPAIEAHLRSMVDRALKDVLPEKEQTLVVRIMVREIVLGAIVMPIFSMLCDSDFWNRQINEKGARYLHERKQVHKVLSVLQTMPAPGTSPTHKVTPRRKAPATAGISAQSTTKQFDEFMRSIPKLKTLGEARRLRSDVERELRSARRGQKVAQDEDKTVLYRAERYVRRLERARSHIDQRIAAISGGTASPKVTPLPTDSPVIRAKVSLYKILNDPSSLAYWLEYMDRRGRSHLVQFWLTVEGFKDPLEASGQNLALDSLDEPGRSRVGDATIGEDLKFLNDIYFTPVHNKISVPVKLVHTISELAGKKVAPEDVPRAKRAVYESQKAVYEQMEEEDWRDFQKSELYLKALADLKTLVPPKPPRTVRAASHSPPTTPTQGGHLAPSSGAIRRLSDGGPGSPVARRPYLINGSFTPGASTAAAIISTTVPDFNRRVSPQSTSPRATTPTNSITPTIVHSPPPLVSRNSAHLNFLFGATDDAADEERDPLFANDGNEEDEDAIVEAQRMEAIQAALNEIIAADDHGSRVVSGTGTLSPGARTPEPEETPSSTPLTQSVVLEPPQSLEGDRHPLAGNKLTSRSAENLTRLASGKDGPHSPVRRVSQFDTRANVRRPRLARHGSEDGSLHRSKKSIFADDMVIEEDAATTDAGAGTEEEFENRVRLAAPGDMQLSAEILRLDTKIRELAAQQSLLSSLIRQAELTGNQKELKLLLRSQGSLQREQRTASFQKAQFEQQEEQNRLVPGRTRVAIPDTAITTDELDERRQVVRYNVQIRQVDKEGRTGISWVVSHRFNEFWELDRAVRDWAASSGGAELARDVLLLAEMPGKRLVPSISGSFVESRRLGLEKYLQSLLVSKALCDSVLVRNFLSPAPASADLTSSTGSLASLAPANIVKSLYKTVTSSLDDALSPPMLDMLSQTLGRQLSDVAGGLGYAAEDLAGLMPSALKVGGGWSRGHEPRASTASATISGVTATPELSAPAPSSLPAAMQPLGGESASGSFTAPICDLFIEVFDLKENNWLRRQAIVIILQQVLGGTIERKFRDAFRNATTPDSVDKLLGSFQETMWPGGERRAPTPPRTEKERRETRAAAGRKLGLLMPDVAANMIGRSNARRAAGRMFGALQDVRLNQHLVLFILDVILGALFPASLAT